MKRLLAGSALIALVISWSGNADADAKAACVDAHMSGQELRLGGHWVAAAQKFRTCSAAGCPALVTQDCTRWYDELRASTPSVVVAVAKPDGGDTVDVHLVIDGKPVADRLPATSVELDPGEHTIRVEHVLWAPVEKRLVLRERDKELRVALRFAAAEAPVAPPPATSSTLGWVLIAAGAAGAITGGVFAVLGKTRENELADSPCGKSGTCAHEDVDVVRQRYLIAGIAGGVGVAALAVGLWYVLGRSSPRASVSGSADGFRFTF